MSIHFFGAIYVLGQAAVTLKVFLQFITRTVIDWHCSMIYVSKIQTSIQERKVRAVDLSFGRLILSLVSKIKIEDQTLNIGEKPTLHRNLLCNHPTLEKLWGCLSNLR